MKKIEELFATLSDPQLIIDGLKSIDIEAINKYWLSGKLQQPKGEDEGKSEIKRLLLVAFAPENTLPAMQRNSPRLRTSPDYKYDFKYHRNEQNFEPAGTLTITKDFDVLPQSFYPGIFENLKINIVRFTSDSHQSYFSTGKICWLKGIKTLEFESHLSGPYALQNIPEDIGDLQDLESLTIIRTEITSIPESLFTLKNLKKLNLRFNKITSLSASITNLQKLEFLDVSLNKIEKFPIELSKLPNLKDFFIFDNPLKEVNDFIAFHTYRHNYKFDETIKKYVELKYPKDVLVLNKSWLEIPLNRIEEIISKNQVKTLRVESAAMLNRILSPDSVKYLSNITYLDLQWNLWLHREYMPGFYREDEVVINLPSNDEARIYELPEGIGLMTWLKEVNLNGNRIEKLPEGFFNLNKLTKIFLNGNKLSELQNLFSSFNELTHLDLGSNDLSNIPDTIYLLKNLSYLNLGSNDKITQISNLIGNLTKIEELFLDTCHIREIPKEFCNLKKLKTINLNYNELTSLPDPLHNLPELENIGLKRNKISNLPNSLSGLSNLKHLDFEECELENVSNSIGDLKKLETLNLQRNKIISITEQIKNCELLTIFNLQENSTLENLPESIGELSCLESLNLFGCKKVEKLPLTISKLKKLKILDIRDTNISKLPEEIFELSSLLELKMYNVQIAELSPSIKKLSELEYLDLRSTKIRELPNEIGELSKLNKLECSKLYKPLPDNFCKLKKLKELNVSFENVQNPFPENFGELSSLERLSTWSKNMNQLPDSFGNLHNLKTLSMRYCIFKEFPLVLTKLQNIGHLDLMDNQFVDVPYEITNLKTAYIIYFDRNPLSFSNAVMKKSKALLPGVYFSF
jgi:Leucine-rich repeat (LRR) protein